MPTIRGLPAFSDNYIWTWFGAGSAIVVDPGDAEPVLAALRQAKCELAAILITHHHADHTGGIAALAKAWPAAPIFGPVHPSIRGITHPVGDGDHVSIAAFPGVVLDVWAVPGHTLEHVAYVVRDGLPPILFCGDTLFACGCGRLFEGTPQQMHASLTRLAGLPDDTLVYCTHEYTLANQRFALAVEPDNQALLARHAHDQASRAAGAATLPTAMALERATNPFLRCAHPAVMQAASARAGQILTDSTAVFAELRTWKNQF